VAIEGPLRELDIHDVFQLLDLGRKTGMLRITSSLRQNSGTVHFEGGKVTGAVIESNPHPLGRMLVRSGRVSEAEVTRARALQDARPGRRVGEVLVEMGVLTRRELDRHVRAQVEEVVFERMSWSEGYFSFEEAPPGQSPAEAEFRIAPESLLMEAARRIDEWSRFEARIPHLGVVPRLVPDTEADGLLDLLPDEWEVLAAVDGRRDVRTIAADLGKSDFEVARTLFGLSSAGLVAVQEPATAGSGRGRDHAVILAQVEEYLSQGDVVAAQVAAEEAVLALPDEPHAHLVLGRALLAAARPGEARTSLLRALGLDPGSAPVLRLLGLALAGLGQFAEADAVWERWERADTRSATEGAHAAEVARLREAAHVLAHASGMLRDRPE
jgi:tetratricopeptide (TPR) repeat protein